MADDVTFQATTLATPASGTVVSAEEVSSLNAGAVTAQKVQRVATVVITANGTAVDVSTAAPLPVVQTGTPTLATGAATAAEQATQTASLSVLDDWDESDRAKVNLIVGQSGVAGGGGTEATALRVTVASNSTGVLAVTQSGTWSVNPVKAATASAAAQTAQSTVAAQVVAANATRKQLIVVNTGTTAIKLVLGAGTPTQTVYHIALRGCGVADDGSGGSYVSDVWTGAVQAISSAAGGTLVISELTA